MNFFNLLENQTAQCTLCPNNCVIKTGCSGKCNVRHFDGREVVNLYAGVISSSGLDPIEKKPLYHYKPGSMIFSVGFYGCNLKCGFCQNHHISSAVPDKTVNSVKPEVFAEYIISNNIDSVSFTYNEPLIQYEWLLDTVRILHAHNISLVLVTNGYINQAPAEQLIGMIDAVNVDLKAGTNQFYRSVCGGKIEPVKDFIKICFNNKVITEVTTLVIPGYNDDLANMKSVVDYIGGLSADIPFHISAYHPAHLFKAPPTPVQTIREWVKYAEQSLNYVYGGNIAGEQPTLCKKCKSVLVQRNGYSINIINLQKNMSCGICGTINYGRF